MLWTMNDPRQEAERIRRATLAFLEEWEVDQPFSASDLAAWTGIDASDAEELLSRLEARDWVHRSQGGWQPGPHIPSTSVDQA